MMYGGPGSMTMKGAKFRPAAHLTILARASLAAGPVVGGGLSSADALSPHCRRKHQGPIHIHKRWLFGLAGFSEARARLSTKERAVLSSDHRPRASPLQRRQGLSARLPAADLPARLSFTRRDRQILTRGR